MKKINLIIISLIVVSGFLFYFKNESKIANEEIMPPILEAETKPLTTATEIALVPEENATSTDAMALPELEEIVKSETLTATTTPLKTADINLEVPFSSQAPESDWSEPYQNACEETASLMVAKYYQKEALTPAIAKQEILDLVAWENKTFGYYEDTTAAETAQLLRDYYGFKRVDVAYDPSLEDIKAQIIAGRPVIIPASGQMLKNPNFKQPGPIYHMLVIKGLTKTGDFITNDNGTRKGNNYIYGSEILYAAIHDAPQGGHSINKADLEGNRKAMIVVYPN